LINQAEPIDYEIIQAMVASGRRPPSITDVAVMPVDLTVYDKLLDYQEALTA